GRQRAAFAEGGLDRVVDVLLADTRANTEWVPGAGPARAQVSEMLRGYDASNDEAVVFDGSARGPYGLLMNALERIGIEGLRAKERERDDVQRSLGMTFHVEDGSSEGQERLFPFDVIPRIVAAEDWGPLQAGLLQRVRALEAFLHDAYGERQVVQDGVLPAWAVTGSPGFCSDAGVVPQSAVRCAVAGIDLVRDGAGRWKVLEDNLRVPSGIGYAVANRWVASRILPELALATSTLGASHAINVLRGGLTHVSDALALVTMGESDSAYFEHTLLAREMGVPVLTPDRLRVDEDGVWGRCGDGERRIEVIYRRIDEDELFGAKGVDGRPLGPGLLAAVKRGVLHMANAPGNGVGDDKALYAFVPKLIKYYLGETPLLDNVPTYLCRDPAQLEQVLDRLGELVVKPVDGYGGNGVLIGPDAAPSELDEARARILAHPAQWIAQETVRLSTHPTFGDGKLRPRCVDLRAFVVQGAEPRIVP
ncbi:circularly permuted type 2 ATP-grasp protein, partial [Actinomadura adrarensis]